MTPELKYDPTANRATLTPKGEDWYLWVERPDAAPAIPHLMTRNEVGDAIGDDRLAELETVIRFVEQCLVRVGYATSREAEASSDSWTASWMLAPGQN